VEQQIPLEYACRKNFPDTMATVPYKNAVNQFMCGLLVITAAFSLMTIFLSSEALHSIGLSSMAVQEYWYRDDVATQLMPKFRLLSYRRQHLPLVVRAFEKRGFLESRNTSRWMSDVHDYDIAWSYSYPNYGYFSALLPNTKINHLRGNTMLTKKQDLFGTFQAADREFGQLAKFDFIPEHFLIPEALQEALVKIRLLETTHESRHPTDPDFGKRWIAKSRNHGHIKLVASAEELSNVAVNGAMMISKYVEPLLFAGYKWDFGLYVLVASVSPLRVFVHENGLGRICLQQYPKNGIQSKSPVESYVVKDYSAPWENEALKPFYGADLPTLEKQGKFHSKVMCEYIDSLQLPEWSCAHWWETMKASAVKMILHALPALRVQAATTSSYPDTLFELFRLDFNTDHQGKPWLVEVNMSPNLLPKYFESGNDHAMKQSVIDGTLAIVGPHGKSDQPNPFLAAQTFNRFSCPETKNDLEHLHDASVLSCVLNALRGGVKVGEACSQMCLSIETQQLIAKIVFQYSQRGDFELAFPASSVMDDGGLNRLTTSEHRRLWVDQVGHIAARRTLLHSDEVAAIVLSRPLKELNGIVDEALKMSQMGSTCLTRGHCSGRGNCLAGTCHCDAGWTGATCASYTVVSDIDECPSSPNAILALVVLVLAYSNFWMFRRMRTDRLKKAL